MNDQTPEKPSLESLNKQLAALKKTQVNEEEKLVPSATAARAAIDFASACAVGVLLGYGVDHFAGTAPWGIVIGVIAGFITGVYVMFKAEAMRALAAKKKETN